MKRLILAQILIFLALFLPGREVFALTKTDEYVRTANYFLKAGTDIKQSDYVNLAKFDLLVLPQEAGVYNKDLFSYLRQNNPDIIILAYTPTRSINLAFLDDGAGLRRQLLNNTDSSWYLYDQWGGVVSTWPNTESFNITSGWNSYLPQFVKNNILSTELWDGVFYDEVDADVSYKNNGNIDLNRDGIKDNASTADDAWRRGVIYLLENSRQLFSDKVIVINGNSYAAYQPYINGRMFESFPTPWEGRGTWSDVMKSYDSLENKVGYTPVFIINANTKNTGNKNDYQNMRFGLASTLMEDGYFGFDFGDQDHGQIWLYDEYDVYLGSPVSEAKNIDNENAIEFYPGVWRRDYKEGVVFVNSSGATREIRFKEEYEKIHGIDDPVVNNGQIVNKITLAPNDGRILLRPVEKIEDAVFTNASFVKLFDQSGKIKRTGFFSYDGRFKGNSNMIIKDLDFDGQKEIVVAGDSKVEIYNSTGSKLVEFYPYGLNYNKGVNISIGDLENDGSLELVTGTRNGGGPQIRIFNKDGRLINPGFFAYGTGFRGGVNVAVGDLNGDGWNEIIAGAGAGGGPHIRVFNKDGKVINPGFFAYDSSFRGGVNVAVGDLNGDGSDEIIAGAGKGGGPQIKIFNKEGKILSQGFFAYPEDTRDGVKVGATDLDGDGKDEILAFTTDPFTLSALINK